MNTDELRSTEDSPRFDTPQPEEVGLSALGLAAIVKLGQLAGTDECRTDISSDDFQFQAKRLRSWLKEIGAWEYLSHFDKLLLKGKPKGWDDYDEFYQEHNTNLLGTLIWALSAIEYLPMPGEAFTEHEEWLAGFPETAGELFKLNYLRSEEEIAVELFFLWGKIQMGDDADLAEWYEGEAECLSEVWLGWILDNLCSRASVLAWLLGIELVSD